MTSDSSIYSGHIASNFSQVLAAEELLAATKKAPAKKTPVNTPSLPKAGTCQTTKPGTPSAPKAGTCQTTKPKPPKKKASSASPELLSGWTLPSQPHV